MSARPASLPDIRAALLAARERIDLSDSTGFDEVARWERSRSGTAFFRLRSLPWGDEIVVKTSQEWDSYDPEKVHSAMVELVEMLESGTEGGAIRPLGWTGSPPLVVMPFVEGTDLVTLLRDESRAEWEWMERWMRTTGAMIASFHDAHRPPLESDLTGLAEAARHMARRIRIAGAVVDGLLDHAGWQDRCSASYGDFGPGNLLGDRDGKLYLLDPPIYPELALAHKDLGNFIFELRRQLAGHGFTRSRPVEGHFDDLRASFIDGYSERSGGGPLAPADLGLIALYEMRRAMGLARKRLPARPDDALWFARYTVEKRAQVIRAGRQSS